MSDGCRFAHRLCEAFANHLLALLPESLCVLTVERIAAHTSADGANLRISGDEFGDLAILTILASYFISICSHSGPDRRRGTLRNRLELERRLPFFPALFLDLLNPCIDGTIRHMPR